MMSIIMEGYHRRWCRVEVGLQRSVLHNGAPTSMKNSTRFDCSRSLNPPPRRTPCSNEAVWAISASKTMAKASDGGGDFPSSLSTDGVHGGTTQLLGGLGLVTRWNEGEGKPASRLYSPVRSVEMRQLDLRCRTIPVVRLLRGRGTMHRGSHVSVNRYGTNGSLSSGPNRRRERGVCGTKWMMRWACVSTPRG